MMVYLSRPHPVSLPGTLARVEAALDGGRLAGWRDPDAARAPLLELAELEAAAVDALCPHEDAEGPPERALRAATLQAARLLCAARDRRAADADREARRLAALLRGGLAGLPLPSPLLAGTAEGYAWYALYPEAWFEAARRLHAELRPREAVCIGLRGIGTGLAAAAAAALEREGCRVQSFTLRPRGHPFERRPRLSAALEERLRALAGGTAGAFFLVADEGPGLSGSSLAGTAQRLSELGVPDGRIALLPAWVPDGSRFLSAPARERWARHRKYPGGFEQAWGEGGPFASRPQRPLLDLSAGRWRALLCAGTGTFPAVHPHHERRKVLLADGTSLLLARFAGLGRHGEELRGRALRLADAGREEAARGRAARAGSSPAAAAPLLPAPRPAGLQDGFLLTPFIPGRPLGPRDAGPSFLEAAAGHLALLRRALPAGPGASPAELAEMLRVNTAEGLGEPWAQRLERSGLPARADGSARPGPIDGRMLLHEWIAAEGGLLKTDAVEHQADHFLPNCADPAWDVAGAAVEAGLDPAGAGFLADRYMALTGDRSLPGRLPFHRAAYLAFRLGYTLLAARTLQGEEDGARFAGLAGRYGAMLKGEIRRAGRRGRG